MVAVPFVWLDWRLPGVGPGAFGLLAPHWPVRRWLGPIDSNGLVDLPGQVPLGGPQFVCVEADRPAAECLAGLARLRQAHPDLPLLVLLGEGQAPAQAVLLRLGVWDCLPCAVGAAQLNASIAAFSGFCRQRHLGPANGLGHLADPGLPSAPIAPSPPSPPLGNGPQPLPPRHKTGPALAHVEAHYATPICLREAAQLCCLSDSEFSRCFKKENGLSFVQHVLRCRLQKACELLAQRRLPIKVVAFEVGFNDVSYFARAFRRGLGMTPSDYQRRVGAQWPANCAESFGGCADFCAPGGNALPKLA